MKQEGSFGRWLVGGYCWHGGLLEMSGGWSRRKEQRERAKTRLAMPEQVAEYISNIGNIYLGPFQCLMVRSPCVPTNH